MRCHYCDKEMNSDSNCYIEASRAIKEANERKDKIARAKALEMLYACRTRDHVIPKSHGGGGGRDNIVMACYGCNRYKGTLSVNEFFLARSLVVDHIYMKMIREETGDTLEGFEGRKRAEKRKKRAVRKKKEEREKQLTLYPVAV